MLMKNKRYIVPVIVVLSIIFSTQFLSAWGPGGHRIIAEIAENHLTPKAKQEIKKILGPVPLSSIATWPDFIYSEPEWYYAKTRHFLTVPDDKKLEEVLDYLKNVDPEKKNQIDNVVEAVEYFTAILKGDKNQRIRFEGNVISNKAKLFMGSIDASALAFLVHFVGDVHQPMHVGRPGDRGGNNITVLWFGQQSSLHKVWDGEIIDSEKLSYSEYTLFIDHASPEDIKKYQSADLNQWTRESIDLRKEIYKKLGIKKSSGAEERQQIPNLSYKYSHDYIEKNNLRLLKGGIRLAGLLNSIFK